MPADRPETTFLQIKRRTHYLHSETYFIYHMAALYLKTKWAFIIKAQTPESCNTERDLGKIKTWSGKHANRFHRPLLPALKINPHQRLFQFMTNVCSPWRTQSLKACSQRLMQQMANPVETDWGPNTYVNRAPTRSAHRTLLSQPRFITSRYGSVFDATLITAGEYDHQQIRVCASLIFITCRSCRVAWEF